MMMLKTDQEMQEVPAGQGIRLRAALVESTSIISDVDNRSKTTENTQVQWWMLALPACAFIFIGIVFFLNALVTPGDAVGKPRVNAPVLLQASSLSKPSVDKLPEKTFVSSIAYSATNAIAFINDQMVSEGDIVEGLTISKIHKNVVEFEKNGRRWMQEVGGQLVSLE
jgi:hypothetical protein